MAVFVPEVFAQELQDDLTPVTVAGNIANQNFTGTLGQRGDTVHVYRVSTPGPTPVAADGSVNYRDVSTEDLKLTADQAEDLSTQIPFPKQFQTDQDMQDAIQRSMLDDAAQAIDDYVMTLTGSFNTANDVTTTAATADDFIGAIREAKVKLSLQDVPSTDRWMVLSPTYASLANEYVTELSIEQASTEALRAGFLGRVEGFNLFESTKLPSASSGSKEVQMFGHISSITMAAQVQNFEFFPTGAAQSHNALLKGSVVFGAKAFGADRAGRILADTP